MIQPASTYQFDRNSLSRISPAIQLIVLLLFVFIGGNLSAQTDTTSLDTLEESVYLDDSNVFVESFTGDVPGNFHAIDTSLDLFQKYNAARHQNFEYTYLGNYGSPYTPRFFEFNRTVGFDYGRHERDLYLTDIGESNYYRSNAPYTDLMYIIGTNSEQFIHALHARNFGPNANASLGIDKIASEGYYQHMLNNYVNVTLTGWYKTKNGIYEVYAAGLRTENKNQENGGIISDTLFELPFPDLAEPFRTYAFTEWDNWQGQITQVLNINKSISYQLNDTTLSTYADPVVKIIHQFGAHTYDYLFEDLNDPALYGEIYTTTDTLRDISKVNGFYNKLAVRNNWWWKQISADSTVDNHLNWELSALQQYHLISDQGGIDTVQNLVTGIHALYRNWFSFASMAVEFNGQYDVMNEAYDMKGRLSLDNEIANITVELASKHLEPTFLQNRYTGFNNRWDHTFDFVDQTSAQLAFGIPRFQFRIQAGIMQFDNYIQMIASADSGYATNYPVQYSDEKLKVFQVQLKQNFVLGPFHLNNRIGYQLLLDEDAASAETPIAFPTLLTQHSFYFERHLFKSALFTQIGFDVWYSTSYYGYKYNLINGQFSLQEGDSITNYQLLEFYPVIDFFTNFDIRSFRFFIKVDNAAQGLFSKGYFEAPQYPMQPRGVKLGVRWELFY